MLRTPALIMIACLSVGSEAQNWCPPGAAWTYTCQSWPVEGVTVITYAGDTMVGDTLAQVLFMQTIGYDHLTEHDTTLSYQPQLTTVAGDLVKIWNYTRFDTLYWFGAAPGDRWNMTIDPDLDYPQFVIEVVDTGHVWVDGIPLRYLEVNGLYSPPVDTIFERIGTRRQFMIPEVSIYEDAFGGPLRCYGDAQIGYHVDPWQNNCDVITGSRPIAALLGSSAFPNPGTGHFTLSLPPGMHTITLFDATGREVLRKLIPGEREDVDCAALAPGLFTYRILDPSGAATDSGRWVKE